jgi:hypothetical protein
MHPPHFMEPHGSLHFSTEPIICPYSKPAKPSPRKPTIFLSNSFYIHKLLLSFRYSYQGPWIYCLSLANVTHALPISFFWLLLRTIFCILQFRDSCLYFVVALSGNLLPILLLITKECVHGEEHIQILSTWTHTIATIGIKKVLYN